MCETGCLSIGYAKCSSCKVEIRGENLSIFESLSKESRTTLLSLVASRAKLNTTAKIIGTHRNNAAATLASLRFELMEKAKNSNSAEGKLFLEMCSKVDGKARHE